MNCYLPVIKINIEVRPLKNYFNLEKDELYDKTIATKEKIEMA